MNPWWPMDREKWSDERFYIKYLKSLRLRTDFPLHHQWLDEAIVKTKESLDDYRRKPSAVSKR